VRRLSPARNCRSFFPYSLSTRGPYSEAFLVPLLKVPPQAGLRTRWAIPSSGSPPLPTILSFLSLPPFDLASGRPRSQRHIAEAVFPTRGCGFPRHAPPRREIRCRHGGGPARCSLLPFQLQRRMCPYDPRTPGWRTGLSLIMPKRRPPRPLMFRHYLGARFPTSRHAATPFSPAGPQNMPRGPSLPLGCKASWLSQGQ